MRTLWIGMLLIVYGAQAAGASAAGGSDAAQLPSLHWEPRSDWLNVRTLGARGDGRADDTAPLQQALDQVKPGSTVYLPAGTYRVTKTLELTGPLIGVAIIGHGRDTQLVWDGEPGGKLFLVNGLAETRYVGLTLDGQGKAAVGLYHYSTKRFETEVLHQHLAFRNFTDAGLMAAKDDRYALAETTCDNCLFEQCGRGAVLVSFNDYNWTFDGCEFRRCGIGVECRHGNFYVRNTHFQESRETDVLAQPEHGCSLRRCTSSGSARFLDFKNSVTPFTIEDCQVARWTSPEGAIVLNGAPVILFDCVFSDPPSSAAPVQVRRGGQRLIVSQNTAKGCDAVVAGASAEHTFHVPAGTRQGSLRSADQRFLHATVHTPGKVFDAQRDFGAKGDRKANDTAAIQKCIDAARQHGQGAIAYLPTGDYLISDTLRIAGKDYVVGGSGFLTKLVWKGPEGGTMVALSSPDHVTLEHLSIGNHDAGPMNNGIDVLQEGTGGPSFVTYENVYVFGMYQKQPLRKGLVLRGLRPDEVVVIYGVQGNLRIDDCARATILARTSFEGSVTVAGTAPQRDGFLGFLTRLATITQHGLHLKDNQSVVMSDFYIEQADNGFIFEGAAGLPPGRATIQSPKLHFTIAKDKPAEGTAVSVRDYRGQIFYGHNQFYCEPVQVHMTHAGSSEAELFLFANVFYQTRLDLAAQPTLKLRLLGNESVGTVTAEGVATYLKSEDVNVDEALKELPRALDDLRRLGQIDLELNHPGAVQP